MGLLRSLRSTLAIAVRRQRFEEEAAEELRFHIEAYAEDLVQAGMSRADALRRARLEFGSPDALKEELRTARGQHLLDELLQDVRYAMHQATGLGRRQLSDLTERLPQRIARRDVLPELEPLALSEPFRDPIATRERLERAHQVRCALRRAYLTLPPEDQRLIALRYERSMSVRQIGTTLAIDPKALYRRFDRLASKLRRAVGKARDFDLSASF